MKRRLLLFKVTKLWNPYGFFKVIFKRKHLLSLALLFFTSLGFVNAQQISVTPYGNPTYVVRMGDSLAFRVGLVASSTMTGTEMQVTVPTGFQILASTPNIISGSLVDGSTVRIATGTVDSNGKDVTIYVKPLCNIDEVPDADRRITYDFYASSTATDPLQTRTTSPIGNFYDPILNVAYPDGAVINLNTPYTRIIEITQSASYSHVNNIQINANCADKSGVTITKVEVSKDKSIWRDITSSLDDSNPTRYTYYITRANTFAHLGYAGNQLQTDAKVYIRETLVLTKCNAGAISYTMSYGDGTTYCSPLPAASGNTNLAVGTPSYSPDITAISYVFPTSPTNNGRYTFQVWNTASDATATLNDISVNVWQSDLRQYDFSKAYFSASNGTIIAGPGGPTDTVWIDITRFGTRNMQSKIDFSSLNDTDPAMVAYYQARGLISNGNDGVYNDLPYGKNFYISAIFNINSGTASTTNCGTLKYFIPGTTRRADICYVHCGSEISYTRPYGASGSTHSYVGGIYSNELRNILVNPVMLSSGDQARLSFYQYDHPSSSPLRTQISSAGNSSYYMYITLPDGLDFDPTDTYPVQLKTNSGGNFTSGGNITMASGLITVIDNQNIKVKVEVNQLDSDGMNISVAVKANGQADVNKQLKVSHSFDYGNVGDEYLFGCFTVPVNYVLMTACSDIELTSFEVERTSFGWTDITKMTRMSKALGANVKVIYPLDNVSLDSRFIVRGASSITSTTNLTASVSYNSIGSGTGNAFLVKDPDRTNPGLLYYYLNGASTPTAVINIPAASITTRATSVGSGNDAIYTQFMEVNVAKLLYDEGITSISVNDEINLVIFARATQVLPTTNDAAGRPVKMELLREGATVCYPVIDNDVKMVRYTFDLLLTDDTDNSMTWYENAQSTTCDMFYGFNKMLGGPNMLTNGEYRPNIDDFSSLTFEIKSLVEVNRIRLALTNAAGGNETARTLATSEYSVTYNNGVTRIVIDPLKDEMFTGINGSGWVGYRLYFDWDAINVINNFYATANKTVQFTCTEYPTSAAPVARTFNKPIGHDYNTAYFYNIVLSSPSPIQSPTSSIVEWPIKIENTSQWAATDGILPNSWIALECPVGITPYRLLDQSNNVLAEIDDNSGTYPYEFVQYGTTGNRYWVKLGNVNALNPVTYKIQCTYNLCSGTPNFPVRFGMGKTDYPADPSSGYAQNPYNSSTEHMALKHNFSTTVSFTPPVVDFSGTLVHIPNETNGTNRFCDEVDFEATFINGLGTNVSNMRIRIDLPDGFDYSGATIPTYSLGTGPQLPVQSARQIGRLFEVIVGDAVELGAYGSSTQSLKVSFDLRISCGMENRTSLYANFIGESGCGASTTKRYNSGQISVAGLSAVPDYFISDLSYDQYFFTGNDETTNGTVRVTGKYQLAGTATAGDMAVIDIPENMTLVDQSGNLWFNQSGTRLTAKFAYPASLGRTYSFNLTLLPQNPAVWDSQSEHCVHVMSGVIDTLECDGLRCSMLSIGDITDSICFTMKKLEVEFNGTPVANSRYNDATTERVVIEGSLINIGDVDAGRLTIDLMTFNGLDYVEVENVVSGNTVAGILSNGGTASFRIVANVHHLEDVCNLLLVLRKYNSTSGSVNAYLADSVAIPVPVPVYSISAVVDEMCQMDGGVVIGELPINDYSYRWSPSDYLSRSNIARPTFTYDYINNPLPDDTVLEYFVSIIRPNGCVTIDTIFVPLRGIPSVDDVSDITLCSGSSFNLSFSDVTNTGGLPTTYKWTIANGPTVGLPASGQSSSINVSQLRNTTSQPVTLLAEVTPSKGGCDGVTKYFVITVNPAPQINFILDNTYCHNEMVSPLSLSGNLSNSVYKWEFVSGSGSTNVLPSPSGSGIIPGFLAVNTGNTVIKGNYKAYSEYTNNGITCTSPEEDFSITVMPEVKVSVSTPSQELCSGGTLTGINFSNSLSGGTTSFSWSLQTGQIPGLAITGTGNIAGGQTLVNSTQNSLTATYQVVPSYTYGGYTCTGNPEVFTVTVNPQPSLYAISSETYCNGQFVSEYTFSGNNQNSVVSWTKTGGDNIGLSTTSGLGNFPGFTATNNGTTDLTATYRATMTYASCSDYEDFTITVKPTPYVNTVNDLHVCSGGNVSVSFSGLAESYQWNKVSGTNIPGISMSGSGNMSFSNITTSSNNSITAEYTVTPKLGHCEGSPASFSITVYPSPVLTSLSDAGSICSGEYFQYTATSLTSGLDYSWSRPVTPGINGGLSGSGNSSVINEVLTNSSTVPVTVSYIITMSQDQQCPKTETVTVVVNPMTDFILTNSIAEICSGATTVNLTYTTSNTPSDLRYDISFSNSARAAGFVNITNATVPSGPISVSLPSNVNSGSYSGTLKVYFSTNSGCYMEYPIEISIVPTPTLNPVSSNFYCSGTSVPEMQLRGNVSTSEITWSRTGGDVIPGLLNSGTNVFPSFVASNTSGSMLTANYTVTMTSYGLTGLTCSDTETFSIEIAPDQVVNSIDDIEKCNGDALSINFSGSGQVYEWSKLSGSSTLGIPQSGTGNISVASLTNTTINVLRAEYSVRPKFVHPVDNTKVCYGSEQRFNISVYPTPTLTTPVDLGSICSGDTFNYTASSATSGVIFSWTRASIPGINGGSGGTGNSEVISEVLNNSSNIPVTVVYEYTLSTQGSCPTTVEVRVTVNPTVDFVLDNPQYVLCSGSATTIDMDYTSGNNPSDLSYTISFSDAARGVGFVNINNPLPLPASPIVVNLPANTIAGNYTGTLSVRYSGSNSCIGHYNFEIIVVSQPSLNTIQDMVYCNGTTVPALVFNGIGGGVINWSHTSGDAIPGLSTSGYNQIPSFNAVNTGLTSLVANYSVTMTTSYGSVTCTDTKTFSITVEPSPVVNPVGSVTICNGAPLNISFSGTGNSYSWSRESGAVISGLTVGTGNISLAAVNNPGTTDITTQIKVIPQSLTGTCSGNEERFTVTVLPSPVLTSVTSAGSICSGTMFEYTATSSTGGVLFSWTRAANAAINGNIAGSGNSEHISEILTSTSESPVNVDYIVTMNLGNGCSYTETVTVSVSPEVDFNLSGSSYSACSNNSSIELLYTTTAGNLSDLRYTIVFSDAARGVGFQNVGETTMTTGGITVSLPANGMAGTYQGTLEVGYDGYMDCKRSYPFTITIYTQPEISPVTTVPYCDGVQVPSLQFRGNIENVYIEWSRDLSSDAIPGLSDSGTSYMPQFTATNTTSAPLTADYKVIMLVGDNNVSCADTLDFSLTIIQRQTVNGVSEQNLCNGDPLQISFSGNGDSFVWSKVSGSNIPGLTTTGSGDISLAAVNNTTTNVLSAQYKVVPTSSNGSCTGVNEQFWIHVYPTPVFTTALVANPICSGETFNYTARSSTSNINYSWVRTSDPSINGGSSSSGMDSDISEILLNTSNVPVTVNYVFTLDQNAICDDEITVSVTVNPVSTFGLTRNRYAVCFDETSIDMEYALGDSYAMDYSIVYGSEARNAGFTNVAFTQIGSSITISLPSNPIAGIYTGTIRLRYTGTTAEECIKEENFTIIINEQPVIYPIYVPPAYCNGEIISERSFPNNISSSTIRWVQTNSVDIGLPVTSGQTTMPLFRAVNNTTSASTAEFKVYMTYRNEGIECVDSAAFSITVEPTPTVNTIEDQYICNLGDLSVTFTGTSVNEFRWSKVEGNTISTIPSSGTGNMVYSGLQNNTNSPVSATYQVVPVSSSGVCTGSEETFRITLYPSASLSSTLTPPDICCMGTFDYTATTTIQGVDFSWERLPVSGIIGGSTGTGNGSHIYETLTNMTDPRTHVDVEYVITMSQNNSTCVDKDTVVVRVNPAARLIFDSYVKTICQGVNEVRYNLNFESGVNYSDVKYNVIFSDQARLVGFRNINDQVFTGTEIVIPIPSGVYEGNYTASVISWFDGYDGCTREYEIEIKVVGQPELMTIDNGYYCHGEVVPSRNFYGNMTENVIFEWTRQVGSDVISGLSARSTGPMPQFVANNSTSAMQSATYQVVMLHFGEGLTCSDTLDFTISIEPEQRVDAIDNIELCSGDQLEVIFSGDAGEYQWRRESGNRNLIADQNGTGDMDYIVSNTTTSVQSAIFSVTPVSTSGLGQCVGTSEVFTVTVYPQPVLSSILTADPICSGERFQYSAASYTPGVQFSWTRAAITGINNGQAGSGNSGIINETLANVTSAAIDVVYTVTLSIGPDCDYTEDVTVTVNPVVDFRLDNPLYTVCLGTDHIEMTYTTANTPADLEYSIEFSPSAIGVGFQNVPYTIISSSTLTVDLPVNTMAGTYTGTMRVRFGSHPLCVNEYSFIVTISEQPQINFVASMEYCNGESTTPIVFTGNTTNVIYYWSHDGSSDVIPGLSLNGYGNIPSFIASNTTGAAITATYTVRMSNISNLGCYDETTFNISILPTPGVDFVEDAHICNAEELAIDFTGTGTEYRWVKVSGSTIPGLNAQGTGNIYISSVVNNTNQIISAVYKVTAHSSVCTGLSEEFGISVYPTPNLSSNADAGQICSGETFAYQAQTLTEDIVITWVRTADPDINAGAPASGNNESISEILTSSSDNPVTVEYVFTLTQGPCSVERTVTVVVNPVPEIEFRYMNYVCANASEVTIPYTTTQTTPKEYIVTFSQEANNAGFLNMPSFIPLTGDLNISIPQYIPHGIYNATVTVRTISCTGTYPVAIYVHQPVSIIEQPESILNICEDLFDIHFEVTATGDSLEYQWYHNGVAIPGADESSYTATYYQGMEGQYYVEVSNMCETIYSNTVEVKPSEILVDIKWEDVLYINNAKDEYVGFQWYKDGVAIPEGGNSQYYTDVNGLDGFYHVVCYYADGITVESCPKEFHTARITSASLYPNPAERGTEVNVELSSDVDVQDMVIVIYDAMGKIVSQYKVNTYNPVIQAPLTPGNYNIHIYHNNGSRETISTKRLIVK